MRIVLSPPELMICRQVAMMRHYCNRGGQVQDRQRGKQDKFAIDVDGMVGEYAFAKMANLCPDFTVSERSGGADLLTHDGLSVDVKATRRKNGQLLGEVKKRDAYSDVYVLMIVEDNMAEFAGWAFGRDLFSDMNLTNLGHGPTYAMPQERLRKKMRCQKSQQEQAL